MDKARHQCRPEDVPRIVEWLATRGGIAIWRSVWLTDPSASWSSPALTKDGQPTTKPTWKAANEPERIITDPADIEVVLDRVVKRFHVATRMGGSGLLVKVTDGGSRRIRREVEKAGDGAYHQFDHGDYENCLILAPERVVPLKEYGEDVNDRLAGARLAPGLAHLPALGLVLVPGQKGPACSCCGGTAAPIIDGKHSLGFCEGGTPEGGEAR